MEKQTLESTRTAPAFRSWFGNSVVTVDGQPGGQPLVVYHGVPLQYNLQAPDIRSFEGDGPFFFSKSASFASIAAEGSYGRGAVYPVYLKVENLFTPTHDAIKSLRDSGWEPDEYVAGDFYGEDLTPDLFWEALEDGDWGALEQSGLLEHLVDEGYDGFVVYESGAENIAVFSPEQIQFVYNDSDLSNAPHQTAEYAGPCPR